MNKPIYIRTLGLFIQDRINYFMLNFFRIVGACHVNEMGSGFWDSAIVAQFLYLRDVMLHVNKFNIPVLDFSCAVPHIHDCEQTAANNECNKTTMREFI